MFNLWVAGRLRMIEPDVMTLLTLLVVVIAVLLMIPPGPGTPLPSRVGSH